MNQKSIIGLSIAAIIIALAAATFVIFSNVDSPTDTSVEQTVDDTSTLRAIKIGMLLPLTGDFSSYGSESKESALYGIETFNKHLESLDQDWYLDPVIEDTATNPVQALEKIQNLKAKNIELVLGYTSASLNAIRSYADSNGVMVFSAASTAPALAIPDDNIFRLISDDRQQAKAFVALLKNHGIDVAVTVWRADTYGDGLSENFKRDFAASGGIADEGIRYNQESPEFSVSTDILAQRVTMLVEEHGADNVGIVFIGFDEAVSFMQSASQHDVLKSIQWFGSDSTSQEIKLTQDPITREFTTDVEFTTLIIGFESTPISDKLDQYMLEVLGREPTTFGKTAYDIMWLYGLAILESGSDRSEDILPIMHTITSEYFGAIGPTILNDNGDLAAGDYSIHKVSDGQWTYIGTYHRDGTTVMESVQSSSNHGNARLSSLAGPVKIGLLSPISGSLSAHGEITRAGSVYGVETFNEYLESIGENWYLDLVEEDAGTNPVQSLEKIQNLKAKNIELVMGGISSASTSSIRQYADSNGMVVFVCCSSAPSLAIENDAVFRLAPDDRHQAKALVAVMMDMGIEAYVPIWRGDSYGDGLNENVRIQFEQLGGYSDDGQRYNPESNEFSIEVSILADSVSNLVEEYGETKVAVVQIGFDESVQIVQSANSYDVLHNVQWFGSNAVTHTNILQDDPIAKEFVQNINYTSLIIKPPMTDIGNDVHKHVSEQIGYDANMFALTSYDVSWIYGLSILEAQSDRSDEIIPILAQVTSEYDGATGKNVLNESGDAKFATYTISTIRGDEWVDIALYDDQLETIIPIVDEQ